MNTSYRNFTKSECDLNGLCRNRTLEYVENNSYSIMTTAGHDLTDSAKNWAVSGRNVNNSYTEWTTTDLDLNNSNWNWTSEHGLGCWEDETFHVVSLVFSIFIVVSSVTGNSLVIGSIIRFRRLRRRNVNFLIGSLAFSNILVAGIAPFECLRVFHPQLSKKVICCLIYFGIVVALMGSAGETFLIISFERFIAIMFPLRHRTLMTRTRLKFLLVIVWINSFIFAFLPLFGLNNVKHLSMTVELRHCTIDMILPSNFQKFVVAYGVLYLLANIALIIPVVYVAYKRSKEGSKQSFGGINTGLTKLLVYTFSTFSISWCPFWVFTIIVLLYKGPLVQCAHQWSIHVGLFHSAVDWLFYGLCNRAFRKAFKQLILRRSSTRLNLDS